MAAGLFRGPRRASWSVSEPNSPNSMALLDTPGDERRGAPRFPCSLLAWCELADIPNASFFEGKVINLSVNGAALIVPRLLGRGTKVLLTFQHPASAGHCERQARVIHARRFPDNGWIIGCDFQAPLSDEELRRLQITT